MTDNNESLFLKPHEREYLKHPEDYEKERGDSAVRVVKHNIRQKHAQALRDFRLLRETRHLWKKQEELEEMDAADISY